MFGLKIFREGVVLSNADVKVDNGIPYTKGKKFSDFSEIDVAIPSELAQLEARKFLDSTGYTKKLKKFQSTAELLGATFEADGAYGKLKVRAAVGGHAVNAGAFYIDVYNKAIATASEYINRVNGLAATGMTYDEAKKMAHNEYKTRLDTDFKLSESSHPVGSYFDEIEKQLFKK